ncbi:MAG TPA: adenylate/guanylate cyclase domain-containing protein [Solirubrobacteraceae bacterium]|jgi:adenylate cyclase|nr:adenylate/guanylate cyclase domain-containing protein [Solirubrobacteraceae bacterium]
MSALAPTHSCAAESSQTIFFADLCGFTEYTTNYGDEVGAELALSFHERVRELAHEERCEVVKTVGDAVMVRSSDCQRAVRLARRILALGAGEGYPQIRAGLDVGPAVQRGGDWWGSTVNTAARVVDAALPGELLLTERARYVLSTDASQEMVGAGLWHLKGLPDMHLLRLAAPGAA